MLPPLSRRGSVHGASAFVAESDVVVALVEVLFDGALEEGLVAFVAYLDEVGETFVQTFPFMAGAGRCRIHEQGD